jgi:DNA modification methylase
VHHDAPITGGTILHGDCIALMGAMPADSVDCIVTDPPYVARYRSRDGRGVPNDDNATWMAPAFAEMHRVLKPDSFCVSFYGWPKADLFIAAWRAPSWAAGSSWRIASASTRHR